MSKDITVLSPNGRRTVVKCTPNTTILQILEDACAKQGFEPAEYDLKHHKVVLDLSNTVRYSNLPNKAMLEMVETEHQRQESTVTIGLQLENGDRRTGDFNPKDSLQDVLVNLVAEDLANLHHPTVIYMRREVHGEELKSTMLRQLGLIQGRAVLRLVDKAPEDLKTQANVSSVLLPRPIQEDESNVASDPKPGTSTIESSRSEITRSLFDDSSNNVVTNPIHLLKNVTFKEATISTPRDMSINEDEEPSSSSSISNPMEEPSHRMEEPSRRMEEDTVETIRNRSAALQCTDQQLERRLNIEHEVTFLGSQKAVLFKLPEHGQDELEDLPDSFYELSVEEVRKLYHELQSERRLLEEQPMLTADLRERATVDPGNLYKSAVVRIQFPDRFVLQGVFLPTDTFDTVEKFIKEHISQPNREFNLYTTPSRTTFDPKITLADAKCVPGVLMHFKWADDSTSSDPCLKTEIYSKLTTSSAAAILASKYRSQARRRLDIAEASTSSGAASTSGGKDGKLPKWLRL